MLFQKSIIRVHFIIVLIINIASSQIVIYVKEFVKL